MEEPSEIPVSTEGEIEVELPVDMADRQTVCDVCLHQNLTAPVGHAICARCAITYCTHFASGIDPQYCMHCMKAIEVTEEILIRKSTHVNEETKQTYTRTQKARHIIFGGLDWLFVQRKINTISDAELAMAIEYHQAMYSGLLYEREKRRVEHFHRNAGKQFVPRISTGDTADATSVTVKKTRRTKVIAPEDAVVQLRAQLELMLKQGLTQDQILKMMGGGK
jgi:hypothetical protein